jgi:hypothetical protein
MFTSHRIENNGQISSVVRCASLKQLREWCLTNGHVIVIGKQAKKSMDSGACVRLLGSDGRVKF